MSSPLFGNDFVPVKSPRQARKNPIGYGSPFANDYAGEDEEVQRQSLPLETRNELLEEVSDTGGSFLKTLFDGIDYAAARGREVVAGKEWGSNPRGEDVLESYGMLPSKDSLGGFGRPLAGFATEVALDPLTYMSFGGSAIGKAGRAAKAASILDDAPRALSRQMINSGKSADEIGWIAQRTEDAFQKDFGKGLDALTDGDLYARPLVGRGRSNREMTLGGLVDAQDAWGAGRKQKAIDDINDWLRGNGGGTFDDLKDTTLGGDVGFGINPFGDTQVALSLPGVTSPIIDAASYVGDWARWSPVGRGAYAAFDKSVLGATEAADQVIAKQFTRSDDVADKLASGKFSDLQESLPSDAFDPQKGEAIRNAMEGTLRFLDPIRDRDKINDIQSAMANPGTRKFMGDTRTLLDEYIQRSEEAGIGSAKLSDIFGTGYFPRHLDKDLYDKTVAKKKGQNQYSVMTGDQLARNKAFNVPGGTNTLQELSLDPRVVGANRGSDRDVADYIYNKLNDLARSTLGPSAPEYTRRNAKKLARVLGKLGQDSIDKKVPIFGQHPTENIRRYIQGRERAIGRSNVLYDLLGSVAKQGNPMDIAGGGHKSVPEMLKQLKLRTTIKHANYVTPLNSGLNSVVSVTGAKQNMLDRLAARGFPITSIDDLKNVSIDSDLGRRLDRIADFYNTPEVQSKFFKALDNLTSLWKASLLSFPARFVRDWYSGSFSNFIMLGNPTDMVRGSATTKYLIEGRWDLLDPLLAKMPRYKGLDEAARKSRYLKDVAGSGINAGGRISDTGQEMFAKRSGDTILDEFRPGERPQTTLGYMAGDIISGRAPVSPSQLPEAELLNLGNWKKSFASIPDTYKKAFAGQDMGDTVSPVLRWSAKQGDLTDRINRLTGFNGLLFQGMNPEMAAKMVKDAQVDYGSLTKFEKMVRAAIPFYAYQSRILKHVAGEIAQRPGGRYMQFGVRLPEHLASGGEDDYVPQRIADKYGMPLEDLRGIPGLGSLVDAIAPKTEGVSSWVSDVDLPGIDQLNMIKIKRDFRDGRVKPLASAVATLGSFAEGSHPFLKAGYEAATGVDSYTGIKKNWGRNTLPVLAARAGLIDPNAGYENADRLGYLDAGLQFLMPFYSRASQVVRKATDPRVSDPTASALQTLLNAGSGVKIENIDDAEKTRDALDKIEQFLSDDPAVRPFNSTYIPKEILPFVNDRTSKLYQLDRQLRKERRGRSKTEPASFNPLFY